MPSADTAKPVLLAEVRTDVAPSAWTVGVLIALGAAVAIAGVAGAIPLWPGVIGGGLMAVVAAIIGAGIAGARAVVYRITEQRIEIERGYLGKRYESIDLFRIKDVTLDQGIVDRMRGVGTLTVMSTDASSPVLEIGPVADARRLYEQLREAVSAARQRAGASVLQ